jgi:hypothetical protein
MTKLYYEVHVTIKPVFDKKLDEAKYIAAMHGFTVAELLMRRPDPRQCVGHRDDTFMTTRGTDEDEICNRTMDLVRSLIAKDFKVLRYKLEDTLCDSKSQGDVWGLGI